MTSLQSFIQSQIKKELPDIRPGDVIRIHQKAKSAKGEDTLSVFEGQVIARKHGKEPGATITVRKEISGVGVEKIYPLYSPVIEKIEIVSRGKVRRAKLYYLREARGKNKKLKRGIISGSPEKSKTAAEPPKIEEK